MLMAAGTVTLAGMAIGPFWRLARAAVVPLVSWLPWPLLVGGALAALGAAVLIAALLRERLANRKNDNNLKHP